MSLQEYMAFMISRETENVQSAKDVEDAFKALTSGEKPYITAQEMYAVRTDSLFMICKIQKQSWGFISHSTTRVILGQVLSIVTRGS